MTLKPQWYLAALASLSVHVDAGTPAPDVRIPPALTAALVDPRRPMDQLKQDSTRHPDLTIAFAGLKAGDRVADFMPGNGYFTRIFSDVVGPAGHVYGFIPSEQIANCPASEIAGSRAIARERSYANVSMVSASLKAFGMPERLDLIWTAQNYHDLHDTFLGPADVASLNRAFFNALKPGGILLVIDHVAEPKSGLRDTETLHRIDPARMKAEIEAAGFVFESHSDVLRNPGDNHKRAVFDPVIRGHTDQVVFRFRKPI
jgi:predicted methyltransferase